MHAGPLAARRLIEASARHAAQIARIVGAVEVHGTPRGVWERVQYDSRAVGSGDVFVAVRGQKTDGHAHLRQARDQGATAAVVETVTPGLDLPQIRVTDSRRALALLAAEETGHPSRELVMIGVTGTNGKTTTTHLIAAELEARGERVGVIGTVGYRFGDQTEPAPHTTPEAPDLARLLRRFRDRGATAVAMEVSSHALALDRTYGVAFDAGVFTNLTQDHLDFHGTMEAYRDAKARLFRAETRGDSSKRFTGAVNTDDPEGRWIREHGDPPMLGFGLEPGAEVTAEEIRWERSGTRLRIRSPQGSPSVALRLRGAFNVMNALAAFAAGLAVGIPVTAITPGSSRSRRCRAGSSPSRRGSPSWFSSTTRTRPTRSFGRSTRSARPGRGGSSASSAAAATAIAASARSWEPWPPSTPTRSS
jgi:UDP-N-acetylmuramoyl-L-alanyl-D-glutamate--2,6-diaminopimelate ligase